MEANKSTKAYPICKWEASISKMNNVEFNEFHLHHRLVCGASGIVKINEKSYPVKWLYDGRCFYNGRRLRQYDISF